jgi:hypothetical protein
VARNVELLGRQLRLPFGVGLDDLLHALGADLLAVVFELDDLDFAGGFDRGAGLGAFEQTHESSSCKHPKSGHEKISSVRHKNVIRGAPGSRPALGR